MEPTEIIVPKKREFSTPLAIVIAGVCIAIGVFFGLSYKNTPKEESVKEYEVSITPEDHYFGNKDADIVIVEYSDMECPFCKQFHVSMEQLVSEYPDDIAWVYRHLPLEAIHPDARPLANASECIASLGGNTSFFSFISNVFKDTQSGKPFSLKDLSMYAKKSGVDEQAFTTCYTEKRFDTNITASVKQARAYDIQGTPFSFILKDGEVVGTIPGAMPYDALKKMIEELK